MPTTRLVGLMSIVTTVGALVGCSGESATPAASRQARIDATAEVLDEFLTPEGAQAEAERLVELCATDPEGMFGVLNTIEDPDGSELFDDLDAVENRSSLGGRGSTHLGIDATEAACTPAELERVLDLGNI